MIPKSLPNGNISGCVCVCVCGGGGGERKRGRCTPLTLSQRQNFGQDQIESICRRQIKRHYNDDFSL